MTVKLRNTSGDPLQLRGQLVEPDEVLTVEGAVDDDSPDDAYLIGGQLWPKAHWTNTGGRTASKEKDA